MSFEWISWLGGEIQGANYLASETAWENARPLPFARCEHYRRHKGLRRDERKIASQKSKGRLLKLNKGRLHMRLAPRSNVRGYNYIKFHLLRNRAWDNAPACCTTHICCCNTRHITVFWHQRDFHRALRLIKCTSFGQTQPYIQVACDVYSIVDEGGRTLMHLFKWRNSEYATITQDTWYLTR
jgi:hypothetical protein